MASDLTDGTGAKGGAREGAGTDTGADAVARVGEATAGRAGDRRRTDR